MAEMMTNLFGSFGEAPENPCSCECEESSSKTSKFSKSKSKNKNKKNTTKTKTAAERAIEKRQETKVPVAGINVKYCGQTFFFPGTNGETEPTLEEVRQYMSQTEGFTELTAEKAILEIMKPDNKEEADFVYCTVRAEKMG